MAKVLIAPMSLAKVEGAYRDLLRENAFELVLPKRAAQLTEEELLEIMPGVAATIAASEPYTRRVIEKSPGLRVIARAGVGYDAVDVQAATDHGVVVTITPGTNHDAVAEHTFTMMLALAKSLIPHHQALIAGGWPRETTLPLRGRTLGIAGLGRIGKAVAIRGACFGMNLLAYEPFPDNEFISRYGVTLVPMERLLAEADYLTLHVPLTPESKHLINRRTLALMKPGAFLLNTARGGLVCEADLYEALKTRRIAGAGLDVFEHEPPGKIPLFELDNLVVTPHDAGVDLQSRDEMALSSARSIVALSLGEWPAGQIVNPEVKSKFKW